MGNLQPTSHYSLLLDSGDVVSVQLAHCFVPLFRSMSEKKVEAALPAVFESNLWGITQGQAVLLASCPHCGGTVVVAKSELASQGFRHGMLKDGSGQIPPHADQNTCETLRAANAVWGCGKPFKINPDTLAVEVAGWDT